MDGMNAVEEECAVPVNAAETQIIKVRPTLCDQSHLSFGENIQTL